MNFSRKCLFAIFASLSMSSLLNAADVSHRVSDELGRGVVAVRLDDSSVMVGWRYLDTDNKSVTFNIYRNGKLITPEGVSVSTQFYDTTPLAGDAEYEVRPVIDGKEKRKGRGSFLLKSEAKAGYIGIPLQRPAAQTMPDGKQCNYYANDASVADLDGDGEMEIVLKWDPDNAKDNSQSGFTGTVFLDAYKIDGRRLWRIDLGRNIRAGAHYTQFMVYDLDGDGKAEVVCKTADGTKDSSGKVIGDADADYRQGADDPYREGRVGAVMSGPEYLTVFNGKSGKAMYTTEYTPERGDVKSWGDNYANRSERYLAAVAYLDGKKPSVVMCRGYYTRAVLAAYDWDGRKLVKRWVFDSNDEGNNRYAGQGNHNLRVADVDGDGCDEIVYGSCTIDHDGNGLYSTGMGHGDAMHLTKFYMDADGYQLWACHENKKDGSTLRNTATGEVIFQLPSKSDVGRCMAADIDPESKGLEMWSSASGGIRNIKGEVICESPKGLPVNMAVWWDGDLLREMLDHEKVSKYDWKTGVCNTIYTFDGCKFNNGTKSNPCFQGDVLGDWREEVIVRTADSDELRIYVSPEPTEYRFHTFLSDRVYRLSMVTENVAYNQPTQPGFYFGEELKGSGKTFRGYTFE